jgi:predicted nicotinamide N-methyase
MLAIMMLLFVVADAFSFKHSSKLKNQATSGGNSIDNGRKLGKIGKVPIISRTISIDVNIPPDLRRRELSEEHIYSIGDDIHRLDVTIWEMHQPSELIQEWWSIDRSEQERRVGDPFGVVMWPGSILASRELMNQHLCNHDESSITNATVLVLGAGTGVEALTAALLGAKRVIATDINPLTLKLLAYGANDDVRVDDNFSGEYFDLFSDNPLPTCDILVAADVLYNPELANQVGTRLHEAVIRSFDTGDAPLKVIVTDSQQFHGTNFLDQPDLHALNSLFEENNFERLEWKSYKLENVCGSGVLVDEDQTYDVAARMISWGW